MTDNLLQRLLDKPVGPVWTASPGPSGPLTSKVEVGEDSAQVTLQAPAGAATEGAARDRLVAQGLDPAEWEVATMRSSSYGSPDNPMEATAFTFRRRHNSVDSRPPLDEILAEVKAHTPTPNRPTGESAFLVALGDMQFGKIDGDGARGSLHRTIDCLNRAANLLAAYQRDGHEIGHVHIAWLGDHIEGFVSQSGANVWRTTLTLNEQIRLTRRVMLHAMTTFAPMVDRLTMAAVPGNHGEPQRFSGKGVTRYDDSHDTESLIAVADAAVLNAETFGHVEFYVPETDELTVVLEVGGSVVAHAHGDKWRPGKHFEWWRGQAFSTNSAMHAATVLLAGHLHHLHIEREGDRLYIGLPALESESTWFRHHTGTTGRPGIVTALMNGGRISPVEFIE